MMDQLQDSPQVVGLLDVLPERLAARYAVEAELGRGNMGVVYRAYDTRLDRRVAIKELYHGPGRSDERERAQTRFLREARLAARLQHPGIVTVYDIIDLDDRWFMVMEYISGRTLRQLLDAEGSVRPEDAQTWLLQVSRALESAHKADVIHRDIKPENVMVDESGQMRLMDFGIALSRDCARLTRKGKTMGTPAYLAPELLHGTPPDRQSDLFAVGVMAYEMLSGKNPFAHGTTAETLKRILAGQPPSLREVMPDCPPDLLAIVDRLMAYRRKERYDSAAALSFDLESALLEAPDSALNDEIPTISGHAVSMSQESAPATLPRVSRWARWGRPAMAFGLAFAVALMALLFTDAGRLLPGPVHGVGEAAAVDQALSPGRVGSLAKGLGPARAILPHAEELTEEAAELEALEAFLLQDPALEEGPLTLAALEPEPEMSNPADQLSPGKGAQEPLAQGFEQCQQAKGNRARLRCLQLAVAAWPPGQPFPEPARRMVSRLVQEKDTFEGASLLGMQVLPRDELVRHLRKALRSGQASRRLHAAELLDRLGLAVPELELRRLALADQACPVRKSAAEWFIRHPKRVVIPDLERALSASVSVKERKGSALFGLVPFTRKDRVEACDHHVLKQALEAARSAPRSTPRT